VQPRRDILFDARPSEYERRVIGLFDHALLGSD
jgi:hypothetical protein